MNHEQKIINGNEISVSFSIEGRECMSNNLEGYPKNMKIKTFTQDCFDGATETEESLKMKEKYLKRFHDLAYEFTEDCIKNQIEAISQAGFFFAWLWPAFVEGQIDANYEY